MFGFISELFNTGIGVISNSISSAVTAFDETVENVPPHQVVFATAALFFLYTQSARIGQIYRARHTKPLQQHFLDAGYGIAKQFKWVENKVSKKLEESLGSTLQKLSSQRAGMRLQERMPEEGRSSAAILREFGIDINECSFDFQSIEIDERQKVTVQKGDGKDSGALYAVHPPELTELLKEVYGKTALTNTMHDKWHRLPAMQAEVIQWCQHLFGGSQGGYGVLTHGGTTSIIEAMIAYVMHARTRGVTSPEIVVPATAHAAFNKAADLTGATLIVVPVNKKTGAVTAREMNRYLSSNTAVMVGSAPSFMNGIYDPIGELGALAKRRKIPLHVDACLGGFVTAFLDTSANPMDFRVPGVTSISADFHKYGCCPKGTSVCLFSKDSPAISMYAALNWPGGLYTTAGILDGSASGARVAEIYATLSFYGQKKYQAIARDIILLRENLQNKVLELNRRLGGMRSTIYVYGDPKGTVLGFRSDTLNPHWIADELDQRGWKLNFLQNPDGFHLCLTHVHTLVGDFEEQFISALEDAIRAVKAYPLNKKTSGNVKVYGMIESLPTEVQRKVCENYQRARLFYTASTPPRLELKMAHSEQSKVPTCP